MGQAYPKPCKYPRVKRRHTVGDFHDNAAPVHSDYYPELSTCNEPALPAEPLLERNCISQDSRLPPPSSSVSSSSSSSQCTTRHLPSSATQPSETADAYPYARRGSDIPELPKSLAGCSTYGRGITNMTVRSPNSGGSNRSYNSSNSGRPHPAQRRGFPTGPLALYFQTSAAARLQHNNATGPSTELQKWAKSSRADDYAVERMDLFHGILHYILKRNYLVPLHKPRAILDIGSGSGIWVREMATAFAKTRVVGVDVLDLVNSRPSIPDNSFDYLHYRVSYSYMQHSSHIPDYRELFRVCRSNGWIEIVELYRCLQSRGPCGERLDNLINMVFAEHGATADSIHGIGNELSAAGFTDVRQRIVSLPVGDWGGAPGTLMRRVTEMLMRSLADDVVRLAGDSIDHTQYEALIDSFLEETERRQTYMEIYCFTGRRP
ncbi:hypothetical protein BDF19DRAFT_424305 [Syncephalis fuscata]|nr:hypothetical protein BDF19DRAFT_424305 [Syncephalis fuscata]